MTGLVTASSVVILLIYGFGLSGASYNTCKDTLSSNGYSLTDSQYQSFYEAANDPSNLQYISTHQPELSEQWTIASGSDNTSVVDWYIDHINSEDFIVYDNPVDSKWVEDGGSTSSSSVSFSKQDIENMFFQQYGKVGKTITDRHGGYYIGYFVSNSGTSTVGSYQLDHVDADGNTTRLYTSSVPRLDDIDIFCNFDYGVVENEDGTQTVTAVETRKRANPYSETGFSVTLKEYPNVITFPDEATSDIKEVKGEEITLPVNPDGTVTLPDGTVLVPNEDGSFTIGGVDHYPVPDTLSPSDLLKQLLELQKKLDELENEIKFEKEKEKDKELDEEIDEAAEKYDGDLMEFVLNSKLTQVFPFCLPFDLVRGIKLFSASPVTPVFEFPINIPEFGLFPGVETSIVLDFKKFETIAVLCRWMSTMSFIFGLITVTFKVVKGSGS